MMLWPGALSPPEGEGSQCEAQCPESWRFCLAWLPGFSQWEVPGQASVLQDLDISARMNMVTGHEGKRRTWV